MVLDPTLLILEKGGRTVRVMQGCDGSQNLEVADHSRLMGARQN